MFKQTYETIISIIILICVFLVVFGNIFYALVIYNNYIDVMTVIMCIVGIAIALIVANLLLYRKKS